MIQIRTSLRDAAKQNLFFQYVYASFGLLRGVFLVPLYLSEIGAQSYGAWLATGNLLAILALVDPGIGTIVQQKIASALGNQEKEAVKTTAFSAAIIAVLLPMIFISVGALVGDSILGLLDFDEAFSVELGRAFFLMIVGNGLIMASFPLNGVLVGLQASLAAGWTHTAGFALNFVFTVYFLLTGYGLFAFPFSAIIQGVFLVLLNSMLAWLEVRRFGKISIEAIWKTLRELVLLMPFGFLGRAGSNLALNIDSLVLAFFLDPAAIVVLHCTRKGTELLTIIIRRIAVACMPGIAYVRGAADGWALQRVFELFVPMMAVGIIIGGSAFIALNESFVTTWVGSEFYGGDLLTVGLMVAVGIFLYSDSISILLFGCNRIRTTSVISLSSAVGRSVLLYCGLVAGLGLFAVPVATIIAAGSISMIPLLRVLNEEVPGVRISRALKDPRVMVWLILPILVSFASTNLSAVGSWPALGLFAFAVLGALLSWCWGFFVRPGGPAEELFSQCRAAVRGNESSAIESQS